jgi:AraC-like DNA-binding protein
LQKLLFAAASASPSIATTVAFDKTGDDFETHVHGTRPSNADRQQSPHEISVHHAEFDRDGPADKEVRLGGLAPWRIRRLQAFVEEHLSQSIHIADLSGAVGLSVPHFSRAFGLSFGEPPHLYVIQRRLDRARHLMLTSNMALSELAVACGFNDQAHLCRLFRQHTGRTPAAWRREWRDAIRQGHLIEEWLMKNDFQPVVGHRFNFRAAKNGGLAP